MKRFYCVMGEGRGAPTVKHETEQAAYTEAIRLAKLNPNVTFYVLVNVLSVKGEVNILTEYVY